MKTNSLTSTEKTIYALRSLYESYGYSQYKMSKFEEYDLYMRLRWSLQMALRQMAS